MRILAHRGASSYAPENTFASFDLACRMGAACLETDVRCTRDGVPVLIHDERVDRTTDGTGAVAEMDWRQVAALDAGARFSADFAGQRVPRLDEFLPRYLGQVSLCLELKCAEAIAPMAAAIRQATDGRIDGGGLEAIEFSSFQWDLLMLMQQALPAAKLGHLVPYSSTNAAAIRRAADAGMAMLCPPVGAVTPQLVADARAAGLRIRTWGVKTREDLHHLITCGVDGTTLNWPDWHVPQLA
ncbi:MAG: glycerophosphodiester phosphodiesterase [Phycisphaeraceae bacterium]